MITINETCSIGTKCFPAELLKRIQKKSCSYPFDWIFSNPTIIIDCINDNFETFLDKDQYTPWSENGMDCDDPNIVGHKKYHSQMFNHRNPRNDKDYEYYKRCVVRFKTMLKSNCNKLFICQIANNQDTHIYQLIDTITDKTKNAHFLIINNIQSDKCTHSIIKKEENVRIINFYHTSLDVGMHYKDNKENDILYSLVKNMYNFELVDLHN